MLDIAHSVCPHDCPSTCALEVERIDARTIGRVRGGRRDGYTAGVVCAKVGRYAERQHHPDRLLTPLRRVGGKGARDSFVPIGWDDALDIVAENFVRAAQLHGTEAVWPYFYAGTMGHVQRDGIERLRHCLRYSRQLSTICTGTSDPGWLAGVGAKRGVDSREIADSDLIVVWGGNPVSTQVNLMGHIQRARKSRGAKLVVVDPYRNGTAELADIHLMVRPGTDAALACAVMHVLFKEGYADRAYMARYTDVPDLLEAHLATRDPAWASAITGLAEEEITDFARLYGRTKRSFLRLGYGFSRSRNGAAQMHAASCLPAVTGAWQYRGGGALYSSGKALYPLDKTLIEGLDRRDPSIRVLDQSRIGPVLTGDKEALKGGAPVTALFIQNTNPMMVAPESFKVHAGFRRDDLFVCVHEQFLTETAVMADIVLPATTFLEHDDIYTGAAHTMLQIARKVVEPPGEARQNHDVLAGLAQRLGATHRGFELTAWEVIEETLALSGLPPAQDFLEGRGVDCAKSFETSHFLDGFGHPDGKFRFRADWSALGPHGNRLSALPDQNWVIDRESAEKPYRLVTAPARSYLNSTFTETPSSCAREGRPTVMIHPQDLATLGEEGMRVRLGNDRGSIVIHARSFDGVQRGVVVVESIWPNAAFEEGVGINALTGSDCPPPAGGAAFHDTAIWIRPA